MSVNHLMHPRNIYKKPPNFVKLALEYPEFKKFVKQDLSGKISVNFKEREAVLALTKALLQNDFGLSLTLPENRLVPTLPLRLNYILWLEDLLQLKHLARKEPVHGIDIGTGAACIYPLLAAKKNNWNMLATEVDSVSAEYAASNVATNKLADLIKVDQVSSNSVLLDVMKDQSRDFDFCMCNPPFFSSEDELECSPERNPPRNAPTGCKSELVAPGGEVAFVKRIIDDSIQLGTKVRVYTTMLGKKTSLKDLQTYLVEKGKQMALCIGTTEFCQGHTTRWGLAWSFLPGLVLPDLIKTRKKNEKKKNPAVATLKNCTLSNAVAKLNLLFKELEIQSRLIKENPTKVEMSIIAVRNTWSHQRRKRRANRRQNKGDGDNGVNGSDKDGDGIAFKKSRLDAESVQFCRSGAQPIQEKLDSISENVGSITEKVDSISEEVDSNSKNMDSITEKVDSISEKVGSITEKVDPITEKVDSISKNMDSITEKVDSISEKVGSITEKVDSISKNMDSITEKVDSISEKVDSNSERVDSISEKVDGSVSDVKVKASNVVKVEEGRKELETASNSLQDGAEKHSNLSDASGKKEKSESGANADADDNDGLDDYIGNKWAEIDTLPLLTADVLLQNLGRDVMVAISLADGCIGGWEVVHQVRQIIINRVDSKKE